jgi:hypothetical protein
LPAVSPVARPLPRRRLPSAARRYSCSRLERLSNDDADDGACCAAAAAVALALAVAVVVAAVAGVLEDCSSGGRPRSRRMSACCLSTNDLIAPRGATNPSSSLLSPTNMAAASSAENCTLGSSRRDRGGIGGGPWWLEAAEGRTAAMYDMNSAVRSSAWYSSVVTTSTAVASCGPRPRNAPMPFAGVDDDEEGDGVPKRFAECSRNFSWLSCTILAGSSSASTALTSIIRHASVPRWMKSRKEVGGARTIVLVAIPVGNDRSS